MAILPPHRTFDDPQALSKGLTWVLCGIVGAFVLQFGSEIAPFNPGRDLTSEFAVSREALAAGRWWTLLTYWLPHDTTNILHVASSLAGIFFLGRELERKHGTRTVFIILIISVFSGSFAWLTVHQGALGPLVGSTAGVYGLLSFLALSEPRRELRFLVLFTIPVCIRLRQLAASLVAVDLVGLLLVDILNHPLPFKYAPSGHLGGLLAGWICFRLPPHLLASRGERQTNPEIGESSSPIAASSAPSNQNGPEPVHPAKEGIRQQVDRILDKINREGLAALTDEERRTLDNARELLNRR